MEVSSLTISIPLVLTFGSFFIGLMTYLGNKKRNAKKDTKEAVKEAKVETKEHEQEIAKNEARLVAMEKDISYIRLMVDKIDKRYDNHETRLQALEKEQRRHK